MPAESVEAPVIVGEPVDGRAARVAHAPDRLRFDLVLEEDEEGEVRAGLLGGGQQAAVHLLGAVRLHLRHEVEPDELVSHPLERAAEVGVLEARTASGVPVVIGHRDVEDLHGVTP